MKLANVRRKMRIYAIYEAQFDGDGCEWMCIRDDMIYLDKKQAEQKLEELEEVVKSSPYRYNSERYELVDLDVIE